MTANTNPSSSVQELGQQRRVVWLAAVLVGAALVLVTRLVFWMLLPHPEIEPYTLIGAERPNAIPAARGSILDANGHYLAASTVEYDLGVSPRLMTDHDRKTMAAILAPILEKPEAELLELLSKTGTEYVPLGRDLSAEVGAYIEELSKDPALNLDAFRLDAKFSRVYPDGELAAHVLGFVDVQGRGQYGVEQYYDRLLAGEDGAWYGVSDSWGNQILVTLGGYRPATDGADLVLTLDRNVQQAAETILRTHMERNKASLGTLIVMEPQTGAILALANEPAYEPKTYWRVDTAEQYVNSAISWLYEPGSVFKVLTLAAALEARVIRPDDTYDDRGEIVVGYQTILNSDRKAHGTTTMTRLLAYSRNVGAAHVATLLGATEFYRTVRRLGFGEITGVDLAREENGIMRVPGEAVWHMSDLGTNSFGQGLAATPIQVATAFAAIANEGMLMRPYVVAEIREEGSVQVREPFRVRRVISSEAARQITTLMADAVELGMPQATLPGFRLAGKSGTSGIPDQEGYASTDIIASFAGFGPVPNPRFVILVKYEKPREGYWGVEVAAPAFREMADFLVDYYGIAPLGVRGSP